MREIRSEYGFIPFTSEEYQLSLKHLVNLALENEDTLYLINNCIWFLRDNKIILPAITTIEALVGSQSMKQKK